jgi:hypothetical protein
MKYLFLLLLLSIQSAFAQPDLTGAWQSGDDENKITLIIAGNFYAAGVYNAKNKTFTGTYGGTWKLEKNQFVELQEFNTFSSELIGVEQRGEIEIKKNKITLHTAKETRAFNRVDTGTPGALAGAWLITGRMTDSGIQKITPGARKTMKILSGTHFQWIAYNSETKEFFGTGGGTYITENGKYTETIQFFSRDNNRVGAKLEFNYSLTNGEWRHSGKSSKGEPIDEIWTTRQKIGL